MSWLIGQVLAQSKFEPGLKLGVGPGGEVTFNEYFANLVGLATYVAVGVSVLVFVYAGVLYSRSQGQANVIAQAKEMVAGVLIGLAILFLIRLILPTLQT